jgi:hypothetical protein
MSNEVLKFRVHPNVPFTTVLESPLPFQIPVCDHLTVSLQPSVFLLGLSEYRFTVDQWLSDFSSTLGLTSESGVVATDYLWQGILAKLCNLNVLLNQTDPSSQIRMRPDFTGMFNSILVIKSEAKSDISEIPSAISELIVKFHETAHFMFPSLCPVIPGIASSRQLISLHRIYYDYTRRIYCQDLVKQYRVLEYEERVKFIVDIFKIAIWIVSQTSPTQFFHLVPDVRTKTRNRHHVTLVRDGILKEFYHGSERQIPMEIIRDVYAAKLLNVEQGITNCSSVTITTVGMRLRDALRLEGLEKGFVFSQVQEAVRQLHSIGVAHCDICVENIFVNVIDKVVFLGDLEYCQRMDDPPPIGIRRADLRANTGQELDLLQLEKLQVELVLL